MILTFCGHSHFKRSIDYEEELLAYLEKTVGDNTVDMYLGGYGNFDNFAYDCCKIYKKNHPNVNLIFITPYMTIEYQRNHLSEAKKRYDCIIYPEIESKPKRYAITYRNRFMVEKADIVIAYVAYKRGGAYAMYSYAKRKKKPIFNMTNLRE